MLKSSSDFERTEIICRAGGVMDSCLDSVQRLIDEVLDITKLAKGVVELDLGVWGIHDMMRAVVHLFELKAHSKSITVRYESKEPYPLFAKVDRVRLSQIVINLVSNAIKFSDDGEIVITLEVERLPNKRSNLVIAVKDHGVGLDVDEPAKLFGLFAQGWAGAARGGTGLGLAISHQLVTLMGGKISGRACVDDFHAPIQGVLELTGSNRATKCRRNDDGHGSLFHFSIPVEIKEASEAVVVGPQSDKSTLNWRPRILLAEDNDASSKIISIMVLSFTKIT
jgi:signal transduction histidine kinase